MTLCPSRRAAVLRAPAVAALAVTLVAAGIAGRTAAARGAAPAQSGRVVVPGPQDTEHLALVASLPDPPPHGGGPPVVLALDVAPKPGMRLYAPGQDTYVPVSLTLDPRHAAIQAGDLVLPAPRLFVFPPTGEQTLVFDRPFRLELPIRLLASPERDGWARVDLARPPDADHVVVKSVFAYQACDDRLCYQARRLPLEWRIPAAAFRSSRTRAR